MAHGALRRNRNSACCLFSENRGSGSLCRGMVDAEQNYSCVLRSISPNLQECDVARMYEITFGQLSVMLGNKLRKTKVFVQPKSKFGYTHLTLCDQRC